MTTTVLPKGDVPGAVWPAVHSSHTASLAAHVHQFDRTQWCSADEIAAGQRAQLGALVHYAAANIPAFTARLAAAGVAPETLAGNLTALPLLTRREVQAALGEEPKQILPAGHGPIGKVSTSGSTGEPVVVWKSALTQLDWLALTVRLYRWSEPDFTVRLASVRALTLRTGTFEDWGTPISHFYQTGPFLSLLLTTDIEAQIDALIAFECESLLLYPSNLAALIPAMERRGVRFERLRHVRTMGETVSPALREAVRESWQVPLHDLYSSEEVGYIAVQCPESALYHVMDETLIVEILDEAGRPCAPGETGRVVVTDLRNHATPIFRYAIGDYATRGGPCPCGRGLSTLTQIMGRERNLIRNPDGTRHWPLTGFRDFRSVAPIVQYQMIQHGIDEIELRLFVERPLTGAEQKKLRALVLKKLGQPFQLRFSFFDSPLPRGKNGKFEEFVSMIGEAR